MNETEQKQHIGTLFDGIASTYDALNHLLSFNIDKRWRRRLAATMRPCTEALDVAIGTGDLSLEIVRQHKATRIVGIDLSTEMMRIGAQKTQGLNIAFREASALAMPFDDGAFDAVTCSFGCRNFSDLSQGLKEMFRVLRPGGEVLILEFSYPKNRFVAWCYDLYFSHILPHIGALMSHDKQAYRYLNRSVKGFVWGEEFCRQMQQAGFAQVTHTPLTFGIATLYRGEKSHLEAK